MSYYRKGRFSNKRLLLSALLALGLLGIGERTKTTGPAPFYKEKLAAAVLMRESMALIKQERLRKGITINRREDPNETGMIGAEYTDLTSTLGSLSSKRTSTNPNFAGIVVQMLHRAEVKKGDYAAVSLSGSFPALNIGTLAAVKTLGLQPVIISSVGASSYGANHPGLTWLDMEALLRRKGLIPYASRAASLGGIVETGGGLDQQGIELGIAAMKRNRIPQLPEMGPMTLEGDIERRLELYKAATAGKKTAVFINVGGSLISLGDCPESITIPPGLLLRLPPTKCPKRGMIFRMNERGIPVIHLLNIKSIARSYGLPVDPVPLPPVPSGGVMLQRRYSFPFILSALALLCVVCLLKWPLPKTRNPSHR